MFASISGYELQVEAGWQENKTERKKKKKKLIVVT
jgi:hypothetical protein